jgi:hypothetical protein
MRNFYRNLTPASFAKINLRPAATAILLCTALIVALVVSATPAWSQQASASITGSVTDPSGGAINNAAVTVRDVDRGTTWTTQTNASGTYEFPQITVGHVEVTVEASGFSKQVHPAFVLVLNQVARLDFQLSVGQISQTVEVSTAPPLLQTDSTELGTVIDSQAATALPLSTRNINQLTLLTPGVVSPNIFAFQAPQSTFGTGRPYVNGAREQDNNFSLDGMDTNQADNNEVGYVPSPDAIQEFNVIAGNAPADFGNYIGGVIVETLKSGTNQYHGDVYEFLRNTALNANSWQNKAISVVNAEPGGNGEILPRNPLHWNNFGATLGGPVIKNKLFFFADWQTSYFDTPANSVPFASVPAAFRTGDFSSLCTAGFNGGGVCNNTAQQLYNPFSNNNPTLRTPYPNNQVPIQSTAAQNIFNSSLFPGPNQTSYVQQNFVNSYQGDFKVDWQASEKDHVMGRWSQQYVINNTTNSIALLPNLTREYPLKNFVLDYARTISPSLVNEARFGFQDFPANDQIFTNPTNINLPETLGIPGVPTTILPCITFNGPACNGGTFTSIGSTDGVEIFHDTTFEAEDAVTWTHGNHVFHFGFEYFKYIMNDIYPGNEGVAGSFSFSGQYTGNGAAGTSGGNGVADFLLGLPSDVTSGTPLDFHLRNSLFGAFVQDNWRLTSHLTVNLGLRYELTTPRGDAGGNNVNFNRFTGTPQIGTNYNTYTGIDNFQPRLGIAYNPSWLPNTVFRAAYGISTYMEGNGVNNLAVVNPPFVVNREANNTGLPLPPFTLDQGYTAFPSAPCTAAALEAFSPDCLSSTTLHLTNPSLQPAVDQQWNLTVQHQFGNSTTVSAAYVGNKIDHMSDIFLLNQQQLVNGVLSPSPFAAPLIAAGANVRYNDSSAIQRYNALELTLIERPFHGLSVQANYTWSKCLSNSLGYFGQFGDEEGIGVSQTGGGYFFFQNIYDQKADYGRCISDIAGAFNGYLLYELPFGRGKQFGNGVSSVVNQIIGGWEVATAFNVHSGFAINPAAPDQSGTGGGVGAAYRPNCVPGVSQRGSGAFEDLGGNIGLQFLNPAAVTLPPTATFGNCAVGAFRGPGLSTADINITKNFHITERFNLQFMTQFINFSNTPVFSAPNGSCAPSCNGVINTDPVSGGATGAGTFGLVQSNNPGRQIQFGLKLLF